MNTTQSAQQHSMSSQITPDKQQNTLRIFSRVLLLMLTCFLLSVMAQAQSAPAPSPSPFGTPSPIDNNDFSQGLNGWDVDYFYYCLSPYRGVCPAPYIATQNANNDLVLTLAQNAGDSSSYPVEFYPTGQYARVKRTFQTHPGTSSVTVRYLFTTDQGHEFATAPYGSINDAFTISLRSQSGGAVAEQTTVVGLGTAAFSIFGNPDYSTPWRELTLPVNAAGDVVEVTIAVEQQQPSPDGELTGIRVDGITENKGEPLIFIPGTAGSLLNERLDSGLKPNLWPGLYGIFPIRVSDKSRLTLDPRKPHADIFAPDVVRTVPAKIFNTAIEEEQVYGPLLKMLSDSGFPEYQVNNDPTRRTMAGCDLSQKSDDPSICHAHQEVDSHPESA